MEEIKKVREEDRLKKERRLKKIKRGGRTNKSYASNFNFFNCKKL